MKELVKKSFLYNYTKYFHHCVLRGGMRRRNNIRGTNVNRVEIEITTSCNLGCYHCGRSCRQAPSHERMATDQVARFVAQSLRYNWKWDIIRILGGEPTLHPGLMDILREIRHYRDTHPECTVFIATNGYGNSTKEVIRQIPSWVVVTNSNKTSRLNNHDAFNLAPIDTRKNRSADFSKGCWISKVCGIGLTRHGFYPCGAGAGIDRVFGFDIGIDDLGNVNEEVMTKQKAVLCPMCGHFESRYPIIPNRDIYSKTWKEAYRKYKEKKPELRLY